MERWRGVHCCGVEVGSGGWRDDEGKMVAGQMWMGRWDEEDGWWV